MREQDNKMYGVNAYYLSKIVRCAVSLDRNWAVGGLALTVSSVRHVHGGHAAASSELPFNVLLPLLFSLVCYWLVGFNTSEAARFFVFYFWYVALRRPGCAAPPLRLVVANIGAVRWRPGGASW